MQTIRRTTVDIGRAFEQHSLAYLNAHFFMDLAQVGGANDGGVDLRGWWRVPFKPRRIRVIAQCKAEAKPLGPRAVRELEGVMANLGGSWRLHR